jgi:mannonate dehydratase
VPATDQQEKMPPLAIAPWDSPAQGARITRVSTVLTAPQGIPLLVVKVETDQAGLIGWGCSSSPQRPLAIQAVINEYLAPMLVGRNAFDIEDVHHLLSLSPYWRGGAVENNALAGIDLALWDIKGKFAGLPVHQLIGGQARTRVPAYGHADGRDAAEVIDDVRRFIELGYEYIRCQVAIPGADTYGAHASTGAEEVARYRARNVPWKSAPYATAVPKLFESVREAIGFDVELIHDVHERLTAAQAIRLSRDLEPFRLFFLEDALAPEDLEWYREMRSQSLTPQAVGEVFSDVQTFIPLIRDRLIDFARIRMCAIGGLTPTIKLAHFCELMGVRLAIHGPGDVSPIGHAAGVAVDATSRAFGIQESTRYNDAMLDVFRGAPVLKNGAYEVSQAPGLGVEVDEREAAKYPIEAPGEFDRWTLLRREDGSVTRP